MKILNKLFVILIISASSTNSYAFPELPFCPAGGPPGWLNHFNFNRDQNIWRRYSRYNSPAYNTGRYPGYYGPAYSPAYRPNSYPVIPYTNAPQHQPR